MVSVVQCVGLYWRMSQQHYVSIAYASDGSQVAGVMKQGMFSGWTGMWWIDRLSEGNRCQVVITVSGKKCGFEIDFDGRLLIDLSLPHYFVNMRPSLCDGPVNILSNIVIRDEPMTPGTVEANVAFTWIPSNN